MIKWLAISLYVISTLASTIPLKAEETSKECRLDTVKLNTIKSAARGLFASLTFTDEPYFAGDLQFRGTNGEEMTVSQFKGKIVLLNMWAMWCVPCRAEMMDLAHLARQTGGENFEVIAVNMDRHTIDHVQINEFLQEVNAANLALYRDEEMNIFKQVRRQIPARGLPFTLIIDHQGCAIASFTGAAPWGNEDAVHFIETIKKLIFFD